MSGRHPRLDEMVPVNDRIRWIQITRLVMLVALPALAAVSGASSAVLRELTVIGLIWLAVAGLSWTAALAGRWFAVTGLTLSLLGDGLVLAWAWHRLGDLDGPVGTLVLLHTLAVTLAASFRTGVKIALWHSLLALLVLNARAAGVLGTAEPYPVRATVLYFTGLWAAALATACLAAVNERELRRRRHDERALLTLALDLVADTEPGATAMKLAGFGVRELALRRTAVVIEVSGGTGLICAVAEPGREPAVRDLGPDVQLPPLNADEVLLVPRPVPHQSSAPSPRQAPAPLPQRGSVPLVPRQSATASVQGAVLGAGQGGQAWLGRILPGAENLVVIPFGDATARGVLILELPRRRPARWSRRVDRAVIATARQAAAQSTAAVGRAVVLAQLADAAHTDGLTGLANRARFDEVLAARVTRAAPLGLIVVDLDHFKTINDTHGHQAGDEVLTGVAAALRAAAGPGDLVARYGGEELVILLDGGAHEVAGTAERLRQAVQAADTPVPVTASLGGACFPAEATTARDLVELADQRLYVAKANGRNQSVTGLPPFVTDPALDGLRAASSPRPAD